MPVVPFIPLITGLGATAASVYGANQAAGTADNALSMQKDIYNQQRADVAPYRALATTPRDVPAGAFGTPQSLADLSRVSGAGGAAGGGMIQVKNPMGEVRSRPASELSHWQGVPGVTILPGQ